MRLLIQKNKVMRYVLVFFLWLPLLSVGQNLDGYDSMIDKVVNINVPYGQAEQLILDVKHNSNVVVLDAREKAEFEISHIPNAVFVGYDDFTVQSVSGIDKKAKIYVYCSIGYRSGNIADQLIKNGYKNVFNLYGGIFNWANKGYPMIDGNSKSTEKVHGYDSNWSKWLNENRCIKVTD